MSVLKLVITLKGFKFIVLGSLVAAISTQAQSFSHADSGWVRIFNGQNFDGLYSRVYGATAPLVHPPAAPYQIMYPGTDTAVIRVSSTASGQQGNIGTDKTSYSHYRMRVEEKFDVLNGNNNGGLTYHTDETRPRMSNNWPRSIEFQMQQVNAGAAYSIQQAAFTTRASGTGAGSNYVATGGSIVNGCETGCNGRWYRGNPNIPNGSNGQTRWLRFELIARGADSAIHIINDTVVMRLWNIRIFNDPNGTPNGAYDHGGLGLQSEGSLINYRRWDIMEFPPTTPMSEHFLHRFFLDNPNQGVNLVPGTTYSVRWRAIGTISKAFLQYNTGTGWKNLAADSVNNTGTYNWVVPNEPTQTLRLRVSGPAWAWPDSSDGNNSIGPATALQSSFKPTISFFMEGKGKLLSGVEVFSLLEIRDVFGKAVRNLPVGDKDLHWDLTDMHGAKVQPGIYFLHFTSPNGAERTLRTLAF